ncbi:hypothetical protein K493DRAFT_341811 [Basidiobolus meristosporus CBS 931.73]|uniref:Arrestin C-terminal-like domain-containing protein n=1 Tax=Basidiobolus meristosporus CBS 931.73 TaxID=1314790 RepID=A0A1Y1XHS9_9FUNG|nr:hypothetical protein K493DRAFT_341811 [Basidiobolus meristosporus CBS 931.73]|eukprot:ORX85299.1 hypothetical protein K493DRAFT_341811 [Basidiobolus meristosporus CBS 931.73]
MFSVPVVDIIFDQEVVIARGSASESQGYFVEGVVDLKLQEPTKVNDIVLKLVGTISLFTATKGWLHKTIVKQKWSLMDRSSGGKALAADTYQYRFNVFLPGSLPESVILELGEINYRLTAQVKRPAFARDVSASRLVTLRRDSLLYLEPQETLFANDQEIKLPIQDSIRLPTRTVLQGDSIPLQILFCHLIGHQIEKVSISIMEHVRYQSNISAYQTTKQIAKFKLDIQLEDLSQEKLLMLDLSSCEVRFSCNTSFIQVEHYLQVEFSSCECPDTDDLGPMAMRIPIWFAPKELQTAYDELPPYSGQLSGPENGSLPSYELIAQIPSPIVA